MNDSKQRASGQRSKKRKFSGNRYTNNSENAHSIGKSSSSKKLNNSAFDYSCNAKLKLGYRIVDISSFFTEITNVLCCKICGGEIKVMETLCKGLSSIFQINCDNCNNLKSFRNCPMMGKKANIPEINRRFFYAMRCIGQGYAGMKTFCGAMDIPPPVQKAAYNNVLRKIAATVKDVACLSMSNATKQEIQETGQTDNGETGLLTVSGDGSWKTRGFSSKIGIVSVVGAESGKVLDVEVMSSYCKGCESSKLKKGEELKIWKAKHESLCLKNHSGSAGMMEVSGMLNIFKRSETRKNAKYINYIGDGDTKTFLELQKSQVYGSNQKLNKVECVGHVQKRMGSRLRQLKNSMRGKKLKDNKNLGGKGRLTDKFIDEITTYYGNAIRSNKDSFTDMRKAVWAIYYHKCSTDIKPVHDFCPQGPTSWCAYQKAKSAGKLKDFKHVKVMPETVMEAIKKVFCDLSHPDLLKRCLGGRTQNPNESFNSMVWKLCPKSSGSNRVIAEIALYEAVIGFNEGRKGRLQVLKFLGFEVGQNAIDAACKADLTRIQEAEKKASEFSLEARRARRMRNICDLEKVTKQEGVVYEKGKF